jgi:hypothetical protein
VWSRVATHVGAATQVLTCTFQATRFGRLWSMHTRHLMRLCQCPMLQPTLPSSRRDSTSAGLPSCALFENWELPEQRCNWFAA